MPVRLVPSTVQSTKKSRNKLIAGNSTKSTLLAEKHLRISKAVFCLGNVDSCQAEDNIKAYVPTTYEFVF